MLRPLGDRVLVKPEANPEQTDSGLWLSEHWKPEEAGTVVAVGLATHPQKQDAEEHARFLEQQCGFVVSRGLDVQPTADLLRDLVRREPLVHIGDYVLFSWAAGHEVLIEDERYLLLREADILAVVEGVPV